MKDIKQISASAAVVVLQSTIASVLRVFSEAVALPVVVDPGMVADVVSSIIASCFFLSAFFFSKVDSVLIRLEGP